MQVFALFPNNNDVGINSTIATRLGVRTAFNKAMRLFKAKKCGRHSYVLIRKDQTDETSIPSVITNFFGEIPRLGRFPYWFTNESQNK